MTARSAGQLLGLELDATKGLPRSANMVGHVLARRLCLYPDSAYGGVVSLTVAVERTYGVTLAERTVHRALALLKALGFVRVDCCAGGACVGGRPPLRDDEADGTRPRRGHAARYVLGCRRFAKGAHRLGAYLLSKKGDIGVRASRFVTRTSTHKTKEERLLARSPGRRSGAAPPLPRPPAAAAPSEGQRGGGAVHIRDLFPTL